MSRIDAALVAFLITAVFILALRPVAFSIGLVDRPGGRKGHRGIVPVVGGICMYLGLVSVLPLLDAPMHGQGAFVVAAGLLVLIGALDDRFDIPPSIRLATQAIAALMVCLAAGLVAENLGNLLFVGDIRLGPLALPFTILVIISVVNAFNMMDGLDGLAGGIGMASLAAGTFAAVVFGDGVGASLGFVALAVVVSFLVFNFPSIYNRKVRTFMGDAGSTLLGFMVAWMGLRLAHGPTPAISPVTALWLAALPIFDLFISFGRRIAKGQNPLHPDSEHFHHILFRSGFSVRQVAIIMTTVAFVVAMTGVLAHQAGVPDGVLFLGLIVIGGLQTWTVRRAWKIASWIRRRRGHDGLGRAES
jgi:UDP-GlcNAc:undecaprenyl-phosphate/decaprenyl-phosphate GlcNAc-1-phosphate transferase